VIAAWGVGVPKELSLILKELLKEAVARRAQGR